MKRTSIKTQIKTAEPLVQLRHFAWSIIARLALPPQRKRNFMRIAEVAPLAESVPPKFYGGTVEKRNSQRGIATARRRP
jgi:hypothetical protein